MSAKRMVVIVGVILLLVIAAAAAATAWLFTPTRRVVSRVTIPCATAPLEIRRVVESEGHTPLHFDQSFWEVGPAEETRRTLGETRLSLVPTEAWLAPSELPSHFASRAPRDDEEAWNLYAPDSARVACLRANLPLLERTLNAGSAATAPVVVWAAAQDEVWPKFRAVSGDTTLEVRVRRNGRVDAEMQGAGALVSLTIGVMSRDAAGARTLRVTSEPLVWVPHTVPASLSGDASALLLVAKDRAGRTVVQRFPVSATRVVNGEELRAATPSGPVEF